MLEVSERVTDLYLLGNKLRSKSTQFMGLQSKVLAIEICSPNCSQFLGLCRRKRGLLPRRQNGMREWGWSFVGQSACLCLERPWIVNHSLLGCHDGFYTLTSQDPYLLGTPHSKTIIVYIVVWVFFWKATCPKNPSLSVNEKSHYHFGCCYLNLKVLEF